MRDGGLSEAKVNCIVGREGLLVSSLFVYANKRVTLCEHSDYFWTSQEQS